MAILVSKTTVNDSFLSFTSSDAINWFFGSRFSEHIGYYGSGELKMLDVSTGDQISLGVDSTGFKASVTGNSLKLFDSLNAEKLSLGSFVAGETVIVHFTDRTLTVTATTSGSNAVYTAVTSSTNPALVAGEASIVLTSTAASVFDTATPTNVLTATTANAALTSYKTYGMAALTITGTGAELASLAPNAHQLGLGIITLNSSDTVSLSVLQASNTLVYGGVKFANDDALTVTGTTSMKLLSSLVGLGGTSIAVTLDFDGVGTNGTPDNAPVANASAVLGQGDWYFNATTDVLSYWNGSAIKAVALTGVSSVAVTSGLMTLDV
ncbi:MAG: hypothetical protein ACOYM1_10615 [Methylovulum sp.]|jgi:hypothetical protein